MERLSGLFEIVVDGAFATRRANKSLDGRALWGKIKQEFDCPKMAAWKEFEKVEDILEFNDDGTMNEPNHFLIQQCRIPATEPPTLTKILQVAFNVGQALAFDLLCHGEHLFDFVEESSIGEIDEYLASHAEIQENICEIFITQ
jgi:hypothetical protein